MPASGTGGSPALPTGEPADMTALVGTWGAGTATRGQVFQFFGDGRMQFSRFDIQADKSVHVEESFGGRFSAAVGTLTLSLEESSCAIARETDKVTYTISGTSLTLDADGKTLALTKDQAPVIDKDKDTIEFGCFDQSGGFTPGEVHPL